MGEKGTETASGGRRDLHPACARPAYQVTEYFRSVFALKTLSLDVAGDHRRSDGRTPIKRDEPVRSARGQGFGKHR